jgi:hypothetical protein
MGYTHYWRKEESNPINKTKLKDAINVMRNIANDNKDILADWDGEKKFRNHVSMVRFNGSAIDNNDHETFAILKNWDGSFCFCKTARKPYDKVVTACLVVLKHFLGDDVKVSSDGNKEEWSEGLKIASNYIENIDEKNILKDI